MKAFRYIGLALLVLAVFVGFGALAVGAQGPVASNVPINAPWIDNQTHTISPNQFVLYRFDYVLSDPNVQPKPLMTIRIPQGYWSGANFEVWTADQVINMTDNHPIGRGSPERVRCDTSQNETGWCYTGDMIWIGAFGASGPYYVRVYPFDANLPNTYSTAVTAPSGAAHTTNAGAVSYRILLTGEAVRLNGSPIAVTGSNASNQQSTASANTNTGSQQPSGNGTAQGPVTFNAPVNAPYLDSQVHTLNPNQPALYRFDYVLDDPNVRPLPLTTIRLPGGLNSGLNFEVWTADQVTDVTNNHFVGRGSPERYRCDVSQSPDGWCNTGDMVWLGAFGTSGPYYVRVVPTNLYNPNVNLNNTSGFQYKLIITGDAVRLGGSPIAVTGPEATSTPTTSSSSSSSAQSSSASSSSAASSAQATATVTPTATATLSSTTSSASSSTSSTSSALSSSSAMSSSANSAMGSNDDPTKATTFSDSQPVTVSANSAQWYKFNYQPSSSGTRSTTITLVPSGAGSMSSTGSSASSSSAASNSATGSNSSTSSNMSAGTSATDVKFEIYGADSIGNWSSSKAIGTSTTQNGQLSWTDSLSAAGTYYVRVINNSSNTFTGTLTVQ